MVDSTSINAGLDEAQARIRIAERNINYLRYADDTTTRKQRGRKKFSMKVKAEDEKAGLKTNILKIELQYNPAIPLSGHAHQETTIERDT